MFRQATTHQRNMESALARTSIFRELPAACKATASADILLCTSFPITYGPGATTLNLVRSARAWRMPFVTQSLADRAHQALVLRTLLNETQTHRTSVVSWSSFDSVLDRCALVHPLRLVSSLASLRYRGATMVQAIAPIGVFARYACSRGLRSLPIADARGDRPRRPGRAFSIERHVHDESCQPRRLRRSSDFCVAHLIWVDRNLLAPNTM